MRFLIGFILDFGMIELVSLVLIVLNIFTFLLYAIDKRKAVKGKWRISERMLIGFTLAFGGIGALFGIRFTRHKTNRNKFRFTVVLGVMITLVPLVHIAHGLTLAKVIRYVEVEFHSENWPAEFDGYRIAFMSDMHTIPDESMRKIATELNKRNIDLLLLGGDFSMRNAHYEGTLREIAQIAATDGIFGIEGNHDNHERLFKAMEQHNITALDNNGTHIKNGFYLAGVHDLWNRTPNVEAAISGAYVDDFILLLSHNPDVSMRQSTTGVNLILCGHTHGGQIAFFGYPLYLLRGSITDYGTRFAYGYNESADGVAVFTSSGIGDYYTIPRIFTRPEVVIFTMYNK